MPPHDPTAGPDSPDQRPRWWPHRRSSDRSGDDGRGELPAWSASYWTTEPTPGPGSGHGDGGGGRAAAGETPHRPASGEAPGSGRSTGRHRAPHGAPRAHPASGAGWAHQTGWARGEHRLRRGDRAGSTDGAGRVGGERHPNLGGELSGAGAGAGNTAEAGVGSRSWARAVAVLACVVALAGVLSTAGPMEAMFSSADGLPPADLTPYGVTGRMPELMLFPPGDPNAGVPLEAPGLVAAAGPVDGQVAGIPAGVLAAYRAAEANLAASTPGCNLTWPIVAGIGKVESSHARGGAIDAAGTTLRPILGPALDGTGGNAAIADTDNGALDQDTTWDRAVGPTQFIPTTWRAYGTDANNDTRADPNNVFDAATASGRYLCSGGNDLADPAQLRTALLRYNRSTSYVETVLRWARAYAAGVVAVPDDPTGAAAATSPGLADRASSQPTAPGVRPGTDDLTVLAAPPATSGGAAGSGTGGAVGSPPPSGTGGGVTAAPVAPAPGVSAPRAPVPPAATEPPAPSAPTTRPQPTTPGATSPPATTPSTSPPATTPPSTRPTRPSIGLPGITVPLPPLTPPRTTTPPSSTPPSSTPPSSSALPSGTTPRAGSSTPPSSTPPSSSPSPGAVDGVPPALARRAAQLCRVLSPAAVAEALGLPAGSVSCR